MLIFLLVAVTQRMIRLWICVIKVWFLKKVRGDLLRAFLYLREA